MALYKKKARSRWFPAETILDANYADDLALLANTPAQAKALLHSLKQVAGSIGLYMNVKKTEFMYFKQEWAISTLSCRSLKWVDMFTYLGNNISPTESDVSIEKVWMIICKSDQSDKIKQDIF